MIRDDVIYLVRENPVAHGVFGNHEETRYQCYCRVNSVTRNEYYRALQNGLEPMYVFEMSEYADYNGEKIVIYNGKRYRVIRSYVENHLVELVVGLATADAYEPPETGGSANG